MSSAACEHDYSKGHVCLKCGHAETWGEDYPPCGCRRYGGVTYPCRIHVRRESSAAWTYLTHCDECGLEFPQPVTWWDDFFSTVEDASFVCTACADERSARGRTRS